MKSKLLWQALALNPMSTRLSEVSSASIRCHLPSFSFDAEQWRMALKGVLVVKMFSNNMSDVSVEDITMVALTSAVSNDLQNGLAYF